MEFVEVAILMIIGCVTAVTIIFFTKKTGRETKPVKESIEAWKKVAKEKDAAFNALQKEMDRARGRANRLQDKVDDYEGDAEEEDSEIQPELLAEVAKKTGIPAPQLALIAEMPQVKKMLGKKPNETIMKFAPLLQQFMTKKQPEGQQVGM